VNSESHISDSDVSNVKDSNIEDRDNRNTEDKVDKVKQKEEPLDVVLLKPLKIMHRIINQNIYSQKQIIFKNYPLFNLEQLLKDELTIQSQTGKNGNIKNPHKDLRMLFLFTLNSSDYADYKVTSICWNPKNHELLALGMAKNRPTESVDNELTPEQPFKDDGAILFYSLKNPSFPENIIKTDSSVNTIDFSSKRPYIIAVGEMDGSVEIFDVRNPNDKIGSSRDIFNRENSDMASTHTDMVTEVKWVDNNDKGEYLVSVSLDGYVKKWTIQKGLEVSDLMHMKLVPHPHKKSKAESQFYRYASGLSIDFDKSDSNI